MKRFIQGLGALWLIASFGTLALAKAPAIEAVPGEYLVKFKKTDTLQTMDASTILGFSVDRKVTENVFLIKRSMIETQDYVVSSLSQNPEVEIVEPNFIYRANVVPNDVDFSKLWGLQNTGQKDTSGATGIEGVDIGAVRAWDLSTGSHDIVVAVIDTGVDPNIPDLKENIWTNEAEANGRSGVDDDNNGYVDDIHGYDFVNRDGDPTDDHSHGSHVAGTIGAKGNDGYGVAGVTWNVRIMGVKFLSKDGGGTLEDAIKSIDYATNMGAKILSNSWGGGGFSELLKQSIERSHAAGALFVAAAGNESNDNDTSPTYPATYDVPNVIAVAALDNRGTLAGFSNWGKRTVHLGAPGVNVYSTTPKGFSSYSGTSMACPHVSGAAALLMSYAPNLTAMQVKERLLARVAPMTKIKSKTVSGGIVNVYYALSDTPAPQDPNDPSNWKSTPISIASAHPYSAKTKQEWTVKQEGASKISVHFSKFVTERGYDKVEFFGADGVSAGVYSGDHSDEFSPAVKGDTMLIRLTSDDSVQEYGFEINAVAFE